MARGVSSSDAYNAKALVPGFRRYDRQAVLNSASADRRRAKSRPLLKSKGAVDACVAYV